MSNQQITLNAIPEHPDCNFAINQTSQKGIYSCVYPVTKDVLLEEVNKCFESGSYDVSIEPTPCESTIMELNNAGYKTTHSSNTLFLTK